MEENFNADELGTEKELTSEEIEKTKTAFMEYSQENNPKIAINFLRENRNCVGEFCLQIVDSYQKDDRYSPALEISKIMAELLIEEK